MAASNPNTTGVCVTSGPRQAKSPARPARRATSADQLAWGKRWPRRENPSASTLGEHDSLCSYCYSKRYPVTRPRSRYHPVGLMGRPGGTVGVAVGVAGTVVAPLGQLLTNPTTHANKKSPGDKPLNSFHLVGVAGFEPTTSSSRTKRATKLRHTPTCRLRQPAGVYPPLIPPRCCGRRLIRVRPA